MPEYVVTLVQTWRIASASHHGATTFLEEGLLLCGPQDLMGDPDTESWQVQEIKGDDE